MNFRTPGSTQPLIIGIGGTPRSASSSECAVRAVLRHSAALGARTQLFGGPDLASLPQYSPEIQERNDAQRALIDAVRQADGLVIGTPGYHGGVSGLVKNAVDLLEDLRSDPEVYLDGRAVGCIVTAAGWQACGVTLTALRSIVHALRGWPTPMGVTLNSAAGPLFSGEGQAIDSGHEQAFHLMATQIVGFARVMRPGVRS